MHTIGSITTNGKTDYFKAMLNFCTANINPALMNIFVNQMIANIPRRKVNIYVNEKLAVNKLMTSANANDNISGHLSSQLLCCQLMLLTFYLIALLFSWDLMLAIV